MMTILAFLIGGAVSGVIIAWALDMTSRKELVQGAVGGLIAGLMMAMLLPH